MTYPVYAYPTTDTLVDNWVEDDGTATTLYDQIDEITVDDVDYIRTGSTPTSAVYITKFGSIVDPYASTGHTVTLRYAKSDSNGDTLSLVAQLIQGYVNELEQGTVIATTLNNTDISSGWTQATYTLTEEETNTITDYNSLYLRLVGNQENIGYSTTAPEFGAISAMSTAGTTSTTIAASTQAEGDLLLIFVESNDSTITAGTPSTPANWNKIFERTEGSGVTGCTTLTIFSRLAPSGGTGNVTVYGVLNHIAGAMMTVTGHGISVADETQIVVGTGTGHGTGTSNLSTSSIDVIANSLIVWAIGLTDDESDTINASTYVNANLASITEQCDATHVTGAGGGIAVATATCSQTTTGNGTWAHDTGYHSQSVYLGIRPALTPRQVWVSWARLGVEVIGDRWAINGVSCT